MVEVEGLVMELYVSFGKLFKQTSFRRFLEYRSHGSAAPSYQAYYSRSESYGACPRFDLRIVFL